ncbi:MAG: ParB/RepB/Spo0J family partition protein [Anaerolineales bacterium]|nr:ParB/RepB/Spo0J family partition protein [Anaerolineales bacterium]
MAKNVIQQLAPGNIGIKNIPIELLIPNPHNPRMLFDRVPLDVLKESIFKVGILVPLTVYWSQEKERYVILDGQRRWMCAQELGLIEVPVNQVAEPTLVQNIVTMFQIHKLREDWELMPTALKLEVLMREMNEKNDKKMASLCGLDHAVVSRCKKLLSYSKKYQDLMLDPDPDKRVKADFFIELYTVRNDRFVNRMPWFSKEKFTLRMLEKYQRGASGLKSVTDFRIMKQHINNAHRAQKDKLITTRLKEFCEDDTLTLDHLRIQSADVSSNVRKLLNDIRKIEEAIHEIDVEEYYGEEELWHYLERLLKLISSKLEAAGRRIK